MDKILVTGGAGYIGAHAAHELAVSGFVPVIVDDLSRSDTTLLSGLEKLLGTTPIFYQGSCLSKDFLRSVFQREHIRAVLHFAAFKSVGESTEHPLLYYRNNIDSLLSLLEVMQENKVYDLVFSSSCTVYGEPDHVPVNEEAPFKRAQSPYGATKQMCERILEDASHRGLRTVSLRYFNPIGAHPSALLGELPLGVPNNLVPFVTQTAIGKRSQLTVFGSDYNTPDGSNVRDFIHVVDLAQAHIAAVRYLHSQPKEFRYDVFNIGTGTGISVLEIIHAFEKATGEKLDYKIGPRRSGDVEKTFADPGKAHRLLGWKASLSVEEALRDAWKWERKLAGLEG